ncbi:hypothetical protein AKO1_006247 [Acrasis kona]|uniref:Uncharacterized protein n=1 Tax=Acrasis kona TaxID=1008807 RepID=A0AAW2YJC2_9EUKA
MSDIDNAQNQTSMNDIESKYHSEIEEFVYGNDKDQLVLECETFLSKFLEERGYSEWGDVNKEEKKNICLVMARIIVFKNTELSNPTWKATSDYFFNGVTVNVLCYEEYPTNIGEPYVQKWYFSCYFDGYTGRPHDLTKHIGWP